MQSLSLTYPKFRLLVTFVSILLIGFIAAVIPVLADHTPAPTSVTIAGSLQS